MGQPPTLQPQGAEGLAGGGGKRISARGEGMKFVVRSGKRAAVQRCPLPGNSPSDRKDHPNFKSPQESLHRCPPARPRNRLAFSRQAESIGPMGMKTQIQNRKNLGAVPPPVGRPRAPVKDATGGTTRP